MGLGAPFQSENVHALALANFHDLFHLIPLFRVFSNISFWNGCYSDTGLPGLFPFLPLASIFYIFIFFAIYSERCPQS